MVGATSSTGAAHNDAWMSKGMRAAKRVNDCVVRCSFDMKLPSATGSR